MTESKCDCYTFSAVFNNTWKAKWILAFGLGSFQETGNSFQICSYFDSRFALIPKDREVQVVREFNSFYR